MFKDMEKGIFGIVRQFSALWDFFERIFWTFSRGPARINITVRTNYDACG